MLGSRRWVWMLGMVHCAHVSAVRASWRQISLTRIPRNVAGLRLVWRGLLRGSGSAIPTNSPFPCLARPLCTVLLITTLLYRK